MPKMNIYDIRIPQGAGTGYRVEKVSAPSLGGVCFQNMQSAADLPTNPNAEDASLARLKRAGRLRVEGQVGRPITVKAQNLTFSKGATVKDLKTGRRGIIIKCNAAQTKSGKPAHKICDENGDTWLAKQSDLKLKH